MCCPIELNTHAQAAHFLGKGEPNLLPKTSDITQSERQAFADRPASSLFERLSMVLTARLRQRGFF